MWRMWYIAGVSYIVYLCFMVVDVIVALYSTGLVVAVMETSSDFKMEYQCGVFIHVQIAKVIGCMLLK